MLGGTEYKISKTPFPRLGGKSRLAKEIIGMFPDTKDYDTYVEPFVGAGNIFFRTVKDDNIQDIINDKDEKVILVMKALKDRPEELNKKIKRDWISKEYFESIKGSKKPEDIIAVAKTSFRGRNLNYANQEKYRKDIKTDYTKDFPERLKDTIILNNDFKKVLKDYDSPKTLFYLDPPYESKDQKDYNDYVTPEEVYSAVKDLKGFVAISYNNSDNIKNIFNKDGWYIKELNTKYVKKGGSFEVEEFFITNYKV